MSKLTEAARGRLCQVRLPGICNSNPETTVLAHYRLSGVCGMGMKPSDLIGAHACSDCHDAIDGRVGTMPREQARFAHLEGMVRTINELLRLGIIDERKLR